MGAEEKAPWLLVSLFGETADRAGRGASKRLLRWSQGFELWLEERRVNFRPGVEIKARQGWRRLLMDQGKMPWELQEADLEAHIRWMGGKGYANSTIANDLGVIAAFYDWCVVRRIDPECEDGFNPARGIKRPKVPRYAEATLLTEGEERRLLGILENDASILGRRELAFFLVRLSMGVPLESLRQLRWGQIERRKKEAWVRWRIGEDPVKLKPEVWEAMLNWLSVSGRLKIMKEESYIFSPLQDPILMKSYTEKTAWVEDRPLSSARILGNLKIYGRKAGIAEAKLNLNALRRTAIRIKLDEGGGMKEMKRFLDSREDKRFTKYRLGKLPVQPGEDERIFSGSLEAPRRRPKPFVEGEGLKHGMYARSQQDEELEAVMQEDLEGIDEEILGMRRLAETLWKQIGEVNLIKETSQLTNAYTLTTYRLGEIIKAEKGLSKREESDQLAEEFLERLDTMLIESGKEPVSAEARRDAARWQGGREGRDRELTKELAKMRVVLRKTLKLAEEAGENGDVGELIKLTEIYSMGCNRLVRLLRLSPAKNLAEYLRAQIDQAISEVIKELGLTDED